MHKFIHTVHTQGSPTCEGAGVSKRSDLRVRQAGEERNDSVHHVFVIDDTVLALSDQNYDELTQALFKLLPQRTCHRQWVIPAVLNTQTHTNFDTCFGI